MNWELIVLGLVALGVVGMAIVQVAGIVIAARLARRMERLAAQVEEELTPLAANLRAITADAARATALATTQVERADRLFADLSTRVERTLGAVQEALIRPAREGFAVLHAIRVALGTFRDQRASTPSRRAAADEDDPLFIG